MSLAQREATNGRATFMPYGKYKDSGIDWLGQIPSHWETKRLKTIASVELSGVDKKTEEGEEPVELCNYTHVYNNGRITRDLDFMRASASAEEIRRLTLRAGDVLITKDSESPTDIAVPALVEPGTWDGVLCGYHLALIRPAGDCMGPFLARCFSAVGLRDQFQIAAQGVTRFALGGAAIRASVFAVPPPDERRAITEFLDQEVAKIDLVLQREERLIRLLEEKRTSVIADSLIRGVNPRARFRDSGVVWLREIPAHWAVKPLKALLSRNDRGAWGEDADDGGVVVLRSTEQTVDGKWNIKNPARRDLSVREMSGTQLAVDDLVVTMSSGSELHIGKTSIVDEYVANMACGFSNFMNRLRVSDGNEARYFWYLLNSPIAREQFVFCSSTTTGLGNLTGSILESIRVAVPPHPEQAAIVAFLDGETTRIEGLMAKIRDVMARLTEFRVSLITAAVTGKINVRHAAVV